MAAQLLFLQHNEHQKRTTPPVLQKHTSLCRSTFHVVPVPSSTS